MLRRTLLHRIGLGALAPAPVLAQPGPGRTLVVGPSGSGSSGSSLAQALREARDGDTIEVLSGDYRGDVAVIGQRRLTIRGVGARPVLHADGRAAERKAILVVRDGDITIENLEFRGARVADLNGAGIRFERGRLRVRRCAFFDNENGILTANFGDAEIDIEDSEFADAPPQPGQLNHLIYVGTIGRARIVGSRFERGHIGSLIKSRAARNEIAFNLIADGASGRASYEIDLPNGGLALVQGNAIAQGPLAENSTLVAYGAEGRPWPRSELSMSHNTLLNGRAQGGFFLRVWPERLTADARVDLLNNLSLGPGQWLAGPTARVRGQAGAGADALRDPARGDFRLRPGALINGPALDPRDIDGRDLAPRAEFMLPVGTRALAPPPQWVAGAFQR